MLPPIPPETASALDDARRRGLAFLESAVEANGAWPCAFNNGDTGERVEDFPPFAAVRGYLSLESCELPQAEDLRSRTRDHLSRIARWPGVWRYWPGLPPDLDDTSLCSLVLGSHVWVFLGMNVELILSRRDPEGRFLTWMFLRPEMKIDTNHLDAVVNANVIAYLGDRAETRPAQRWLEGLVMDGREASALVFYPESLDLHVALARAAHLVPAVFRSLFPVLVDRVSARVEALRDGTDLMRLAEGVTALDMLGQVPSADLVRSAAATMLRAQRPEGVWSSDSAVWLGLPERSDTFTSPALETACCIDAISRLLRK